MENILLKTGRPLAQDTCSQSFVKLFADQIKSLLLMEKSYINI